MKITDGMLTEMEPIVPQLIRELGVDQWQPISTALTDILVGVS